MNQEKMVMGVPPEKENKSKKGFLIILVCIVFLLVIGTILFRNLVTPPDAQLSETAAKPPTEEGIAKVTDIPASVESIKKEEPQVKTPVAPQPQEKIIEPSPATVENFKTASEMPEKFQTGESEKVEVAKKDTGTYTAMSESKDESKYYIVQDGDCLWDISRNPDILGDPFKWDLIFKKNMDQIDNPDLIYPGQKLIIPKKY